MRRSHILVAAFALTALTGCGSPKQAEAPPKVATLVSAAPSASPSPTSQRPRHRLDETDEEFKALFDPLYKCLEEHGIDNPRNNTVTLKKASDAAQRPATSKGDTTAVTAFRFCEPLYAPLPPWEKDPANPEARDFNLAVMKCLKAKGVKHLEPTDDGLSYSLGAGQDDEASIVQAMRLEPECEREAAAAKK
ncbi:hypothetical protein GCM10010435_23230 [Winogradskya consettensis]|uniref:Lipoprotein n=1 Tax=Winogradskya consettensis TaxID=113560 RepID=A0A919VTK4_9ACTN|nr:hypothetical protein [Actinoplanes consettensis]GIM75357.1 hypothetical protein Aco04nite_44940 [Actinoplanes consettensis]